MIWKDKIIFDKIKKYTFVTIKNKYLIKSLKINSIKTSVQ